MKKIISLILTFAVVFSLFTFPVSAATTITLNETEIIFRGNGGTYQLTAKTSLASKVTWKTDDEKIAKVSKDGLVTAVKKGETTITATVNSISAKCKVIVSDNGGSGMAIVNGEWTYYSTNAGLYKIKANSKNPVMLVEGYCNNINVYGDYVYYVTSSTYENLTVESICKVKINGKNFKELKSGEIVSMQVIDGVIYYETGNANDGYKFNKMDLDGINSKLIITTNVGNYTVKDDWIYYINSDDNDKIYKINTNGTNNTKINNDKCFSFAIIDNVIYYLNRSDKQNLYSMQLNGKNKKKLNNALTSDFRVVDNEIYYKNWSDKGKIYKMKIDGKNQKAIIVERNDEYIVKDGWIYYIYDTKIYKIKTDGTNKKELYDGGSKSWIINFTLVDDWIFFQNYFLAHKVRTNGKDAQNIDIGISSEEYQNYPLIKYSIKSITDKTITITVQVESDNEELAHFEVYDKDGNVLHAEDVSGYTFKTDYKIKENGYYKFCIKSIWDKKFSIGFEMNELAK